MSEDIFSELLETLKELISSQHFNKKLQLIVEKSAKLSGCSRVCFIILNKRGELIVRAGFPEGSHGIGKKIVSDLGEDFLMKIIKDAIPVIITNPKTDPRTSYMKDLANTYDISAVMFYPLSFKGESLGILIFDAVADQKFTKESIKIIDILADVTTRVLVSEYEKKRNEEQKLNLYKLYELRNLSIRIAHTIRNSLSVLIGAYAKRMDNILDKHLLNGESGKGNKYISEIKDYTNIILSEVEKLEHLMDGILSISGSVSVCIEPENFNDFIRKEVESISFDGDVELNLDEHLERVRVCFDERLISIALRDILKILIDSHANRIMIRTKIKPKSRSFSVFISSNGEKIAPTILPDVFETFMTTKADRTGISLANARALIEAHGGNISIRDNTDLTFEISLPIMSSPVPIC